MGEITHNEAASILASMHFGVMSNADESIGKLYRYIEQQRAAQRAASVRVVEVLQEAESFNRSVDYPINIKAGQELAIIERRAEAAAGEGEMP